jgi:Domain of unknown function (DUF4292)
VKNIKSIIYIAFSVIILSCNTTKKATTTAVPEKPATLPPLSISTILSNLKAREINADWLSSDMDIDYQGKPMSLSASMNSRFRKDSIIWMNVKKLGFNVARAKITPDSVFVINYLQSNYLAKDLKYIEKQYNLPADFKMLQNILLGNPVFLTDTKQLTFDKIASGDIVMKGKDSQWQTTYTLDAKGETLKEMLFEQPIASRSMKVTYGNFDILKGYGKNDTKFAYLRTLNIDSPQTGKASISLEIEPSSLEVNVPKNIKFDIPTHYQRLE